MFKLASYWNGAKDTARITKGNDRAHRSQAGQTVGGTHTFRRGFCSRALLGAVVPGWLTMAMATSIAEHARPVSAYDRESLAKPTQPHYSSNPH